MKSVKRKLEEPKGHLNGSHSPVSDGQRSSPKVNHQLPEIQPSVQKFSDVQPSTSFNAASVVTTTTTTTTARFTSCQPEVVTQQGNHDDKNSILKLSVKIPPGFNMMNGSHTKTEDKPPVGITLTKTGGEPGSTALYKSSVLQTNSNATTPNVTATEFSPAISATAAMLRRYYEDQKLRLQQAEEFNRLRFTKGNNPLTNAPLKDTLASSSSSTTRPTPPVVVTSITAPSIDAKPKATVTVTTSLSTVTPLAKPMPSVAKQSNGYSNGVPSSGASTSAKSKQQKGEATDEAATDGDDEREDDDEDEDDEDDDDDDDYEDDDDDDDDSDDVGRIAKTDNKDGESNGGRKRVAPANSNEERIQISNKANHVNNQSSNSVDANEVNKVAPNNGTSTVLHTPGGHKSDNNSKRIMYNKALGETMLHRAARLGQMDHLKYYLETQSSTLDAKDNAGYSPLHECCSRGHIEAAKMLLQYGADVNSAAAGGVRPIHDAVENDHLEIVRLLLSYGADPLIATYSGLTPLKLARSPAMMEFFKGFLADITGESNTPILPWQFRGSAGCLDAKLSGYDPLENLPSEDEGLSHHQNTSGEDCDVDDDAALIFEVSDKPHIPTYHVPATRRNGSGILSFCLLQDVLNQTGMNRSAFLACYPDIQVERMAKEEFSSHAKCTQIMVDPSSALKNGSYLSTDVWVELVQWDNNLRDILDIERIVIPTTSLWRTQSKS